MFSEKTPKRASTKSTVLVMAFIMALSTVTVAQAGWTSAFLGTDMGNARSSDADAPQKKCKKKNKKKCKKKPSPQPSSSPSSSATAPAPSPSGSSTAPAPEPSPTGSGPAPPTAAKGRVVEFTYLCPCPGVVFFPAVNLGGGNLALESGELYLTAVASDSTGQPVAVSMQQAEAAIGDFCGETSAPLALTEGVVVDIWVGNPTICPGPALGGTITFTLTSSP